MTDFIPVPTLESLYFNDAVLMAKTINSLVTEVDALIIALESLSIRIDAFEASLSTPPPPPVVEEPSE